MFEKHLSLRKAANRLRLKKSTAERIINRFRKNGTFFETKEAKKVRIEKEGSRRKQAEEERCEEEPLREPKESESCKGEE